MDVTKETSEVSGLQHGHTVAGYGSSPAGVKICERFPIFRGLLLFCPGTEDDVPNTATVFVGGPSVTPDYGPKGGIPLVPGRSLVVPIDDPSQLYIVSDAPGQDVAWMGV